MAPIAFLLLLYVSGIHCSDITTNVFGNLLDGMPAAFGDFNSDELTDVFVLRNKSKTVEILLSSEEEPLFRASKHLKCHYNDSIITSVVPGDFDGDAYMDMMVTVMKISEKKNQVPHTYVYINWGGGSSLNCSDEKKPLLNLTGQPLALDYNQDMIIDLFGLSSTGQRTFWIFDKTRGKPTEIYLQGRDNELQMPHAHAFLDLNKDNTADLFLTTTTNFQVWFGHEQKDFTYSYEIEHPKDHVMLGQSLFIDVELRGRVDLVTPVCYDKECKNSTLLVYCDKKWHNLQVNFKDNNNVIWRYCYVPGKQYINLITTRSGDFNMDGYPDLLATLCQSPNGEPQTFILENVACESGCGDFTRTFLVRWKALSPFAGGTVMGAFFDFYQDGILDVILVKQNNTDYKVAAFKNSLDYDANFIKVMVLTGLQNDDNKMIDGRVGKKRRTYGTNLCGPTIGYATTTQEGNKRHAVSAQLPQSAHFSLNLPFSIFGLGRAPNFVENVTVGLSNHSRLWTQIIPNSQIVVIPWPTDEPTRWKAQLFVTPSKLILMSVAALTGVCGLITIIIGILHWKERQDDKRERMSESHRFHFDAM